MNDRKSRGNKRFKFNLPTIEFKSVIKDLRNKKLIEQSKNKRNDSTKTSRFYSSRSLKLKITKKEDKNISRTSLFKVDK